MGNIVLADRIAGLEESATLALNARVKQMAAEGKTVYNLTAGELACETPAAIQKFVADKLRHNKYTPTAGLPELRQKLAEHAREFYAADWIQPEHTVITAGGKPALYASLLTVVNPGDEVIVPVPAWVSYRHLIELAGGKMITVPLTETFDVDAPAVLAAVTPRTKAIIINSPHNPTGAVFSAESLQALADGLRGSGITVISDDMYAKLSFVPYTPVTTYGFEQLIITNGFSKSQALTGWRIGYLIADTDIVAAVTKVLSHTMGNPALPSQYAALAALEGGDKQVMYNTLQQQRDLVSERLAAIPQLRFAQPNGAFYVFIDVRGINENSMEWCEALLNATGVALVPGEAFEAPGFVRLSYVADPAVLTAGLDALANYVKQGAIA